MHVLFVLFTDLGNVSALGGLNTQALQAANLSGLLGNGLGGADLSSLVQNPLAPQSQATPFGNLSQNSANLGNSNGMGNFARGGNDNSGYGSQSNSSFQGGGDGRFQSSFSGGGNDRLTNFSGNNSMMRPSMEGKSFSRKVLVSNVSFLGCLVVSCRMFKLRIVLLFFINVLIKQRFIVDIISLLAATFR